MNQNNTKGKAMTLIDKVNSVKSLLKKARPAIEQMLPKHLTADRMLKVAINAVTRNPVLLECDQYSLVAAIMQASQFGLSPDGVTGEAYLVPFWNNKRGVKEVQLIPGYRGLMKLARQSGEISHIEARVVYENDTFEFSFGLEPKLIHIPNLTDDPGEIAFFYAIARPKDSSIPALFEVMSKRQVDGIRAMSKSKNSDAWCNHYEEMGRKTTVRRISKYIPQDTERNLATAIHLDDSAEAKEPQIMDLGIVEGLSKVGIDREPEPEPETKTEEIASELANKVKTTGADVEENPDDLLPCPVCCLSFERYHLDENCNMCNECRKKTEEPLKDDSADQATIPGIGKGRKISRDKVKDK